jgi:uncharacterized LabA/DUF88 family protein
MPDYIYIDNSNLYIEGRRVSAIDTGIATLLTKDAYKFGKPGVDTFVLVAGDRDYVPTCLELKKDGYQFEVIFWNHAARELRETASKFIALNDHLEYLRLT